MKNFTFIELVILIGLLTIASIVTSSKLSKLSFEMDNISARQRVQKLRNDDLEARIKELESKR